MSASGWIEIGALWKRKDGKKGLTGKMGTKARLIVQLNEKREGEAGRNDPDYRLFVAPLETEVKAGREPGDDL